MIRMMGSNSDFRIDVTIKSAGSHAFRFSSRIQGHSLIQPLTIASRIIASA